MTTKSEAETIELGIKLASELKETLGKKPLLILLQGEMGAGKTQFVKGLAQGLGIEEAIVSPSYVYICEYALPDSGKLIHVDAWRVEKEEDFLRLGLQDYLKLENVVVIEWPRDYMNKIPLRDVEAHRVIFRELDPNTREIELSQS